jgi:hypothetical protein
MPKLKASLQFSHDLESTSARQITIEGNGESDVPRAPVFEMAAAAESPRARCPTRAARVSEKTGAMASLIADDSLNGKRVSNIIKMGLR